jgi:hypothetical protein
VAALADVRLGLAGHHARGFHAVGVADVRIIADPDDRLFGARLREAAATLPADAGLVVLGSGALPLADARDRRTFVLAAAADDAEHEPAAASDRPVAASDRPVALANNLYSSDALAIPGARRVLAELPDLPGDNALPRWLLERAGLPVADLRGRRALQADLDGLADLALLVRSPRCPAVLRAAAAHHAARLAPVRERMEAVAAVAADRRAEIVVAGRVSAASLRRLESATACRVRALVEERGLRAADPRAQADFADRADPSTPQRPPASVLGMLLDRDGPSALGAILTRLGDAAVVDTRVLLAHRLGADERSWPSLEDRLASDLGMADGVVDPWLRALTESADAAPIPVLLGAHSLVGPGLDLLFVPQRTAPRRLRSADGARGTDAIAGRGSR